MTFSKHQHVTYEVRGTLYSAIVRTAHRDGSCTVEARFALGADGEPRGCYVGVKVRLYAADLSLVP